MTPTASPLKIWILEYLYRDGSNWKTWKRVRLREDRERGQVAALLGTLMADGQFSAQMVGLPDLRPHHQAIYGGDDILDHCWHELHSLRPAMPDEHDVEMLSFTLSSLVKRFEAAAGQAWGQTRSSCTSAHSR